MRALLLHEGNLSSIAQARALAEALGVNVIGQMQPQRPFLAPLLAARILAGPLGGLVPMEPLEKFADSHQVDLVIGCGSKSAAQTALLRRQGRRTAIQILNPRFGSQAEQNFDFIVTPKHDLVEGDQVFRTRGSLTWVSPERIKELRTKKSSFKKEEMAFVGKGRRLVFLIGGNTFRRPMDATGVFCKLMNIVKKHSSDFDQFLVVGSRRTPTQLENYLSTESSCSRIRAWFPFDPDTANPYRICLVFGDAFVVTGDSVSMVSDACSTGKPVQVLREFADGCQSFGKLSRFHAMLEAENFLSESLLDDETLQRPHFTDARDAAAFILSHHHLLRAS